MPHKYPAVGGKLFQSIESKDCAADNAVSVLYLSDGHFRHKKPWRGSGLAIPVFSMRTKESVGCGDFMDLKKMVDFVSACGMHVLQVRLLAWSFSCVSWEAGTVCCRPCRACEPQELTWLHKSLYILFLGVLMLLRLQVLPVNDTQVYHTFWDSYPYSAISVFALHPLYLSLQALVKGKVPAAVSDEILEVRQKHTAVDMDYTTTIADKLRIARMVFDSPQGRMCAPPPFSCMSCCSSLQK